MSKRTVEQAEEELNKNGTPVTVFTLLVELDKDGDARDRRGEVVEHERDKKGGKHD